MKKQIPETFEPTARKLTKVKDSTKKSRIFRKSDFETEKQQKIVPVEIDSADGNDFKQNIGVFSNICKSSDLLREPFGSIKRSNKSLGTDEDDTGRAKILRVFICTLGGDELKIDEDVYDLTAGIQKLYLRQDILQDKRKKKKTIF